MLSVFYRTCLERSVSPKTTYQTKSSKAFQKIISFPLSRLINLSIKHNFIPQSWKPAKIIPLFKSRDPSETTNYRPISLLSSFSKVLEKAIYKQTYNYLDRHSLLYKHQYSVRASHSCEKLLIKLQYIIFNARNAKQHACVVFLDLKKKLLTPSTLTVLQGSVRFQSLGYTILFFLTRTPLQDDLYQAAACPFFFVPLASSSATRPSSSSISSTMTTSTATDLYCGRNASDVWGRSRQCRGARNRGSGTTAAAKQGQRAEPALTTTSVLKE